MFAKKEMAALLEYATSKGYKGYNGFNYISTNKQAGSIKRLLKDLNINPKTVTGPNSAELIDLLEALEDMPKLADRLEPIFQSLVYVSKTKVINNDNAQKFSDFYADLVPVTNVEDTGTDEGIIFFDTVKREVIRGLRPEPILMAHALTKKDVMESLQYLAVIRFEPFIPEVSFKTSYRRLGDITAYNLAPKMDWLEVEPDSEEMPEMAVRLLNHLFPDLSSREYVLDWMHHSLAGRCDTALVLVGRKGTGKNVFCQMLGALHARESVQFANQAFLTEKFNAQMDKARLIVLDEVNLQEDGANASMKRYLNDRIALEKKGTDAFTIKNYCSFILLSNDSNMGIEPNDRRFSIPSISEQNLKVSIKEKEISEFMSMLESDSEEKKQFCANLGHYLKNRVPKYSRTEPFKNEYFHKVAYNSLSDWKQAVIEYLEAHGEEGKRVTFIDMYRKVRVEDRERFRISQKSAETFVNEYLHKGEYRLGNVVQIQRKGKLTAALEPNPDLLKILKKEYEIKLKMKEIIVEEDSPMFKRQDMTASEDLL